MLDRDYLSYLGKETEREREMHFGSWILKFHFVIGLLWSAMVVMGMYLMILSLNVLSHII